MLALQWLQPARMTTERSAPSVFARGTSGDASGGGAEVSPSCSLDSALVLGASVSAVASGGSLGPFEFSASSSAIDSFAAASNTGSYISHDITGCLLAKQMSQIDN